MSSVFKGHNLLIWLEEITEGERNKNVTGETEGLVMCNFVGHCIDCDFEGDWQPEEGLSR